MATAMGAILRSVVLAAFCLLESGGYLLNLKSPVFWNKRSTMSNLRLSIRRNAVFAPKMNLGNVKPSEVGIGKAAPPTLRAIYDATSTFTDGELVVVRRGDGGECLGRIEQRNPEGTEYLICVDEANGKFVKESPLQIGKIPIKSPVYDHEAAFPPPASMKDAHINSFEEYSRLYRQSLDDPEAFWSSISKSFHWETPWHTLNKVNFDTTKGPISIEW